MNNSTKIRIRVPKHLYESIQAELNKKQAPMEEMKDEKMEEGEEPMNESAIGAVMDAVKDLDPDALVQALKVGLNMTDESLKNLFAGAGAILGVGGTLAGAAMKDKKAGIKSTVKDVQEVRGEVDQLAEAIKKVLDKKKEAKKKAAEAEKEKAAKDKEKEKAAKEKEAEAKKKAAEAKKKADAKKK